MTSSRLPSRETGGMVEPTEDRIRELHRRGVSWAYPLDTWGNYERKHEDDVVERVLSALRGTDDRPWMHSHYSEDVGMCTECDAAYVLERLEEEDDD